jgi:hypothetical protein
MLLIQNLGIKGTGFIDSRNGKEQRGSYAIYQCPVCKGTFERLVKKMINQKTCKACQGTQKISHGMANRPVYNTWQQIIQRCENPKNKKYPIYGGKGITVDPKWKTFEGFWSEMGNTYEEGLTIDRKDSSLGYNKENCRWLTKSKNSSETTKRRPVIQMREVLVPSKMLIEVKRWDCAKVAADELGLIATHITVVCMGKRKTHGGFYWKYA